MISRYETMQAQGGASYFDVSECEDIIDYYDTRYEEEKAMQAVLWAEKLHPLSPSIQLIKASLFAFNNKPRKALNIIARLEQQESACELDVFRLKVSKAFALIATGKYEEAYELQQDLLHDEAIDSADVEYALTVITFGLLRQEEFLQAILNLLHFEKKIQLSSTLLGYLAYAFAEMNEVSSAVEYYKKGIAQDPFDPVLWCDMADLLDDNDEAIKAYDYALLLDEKMAPAYCGKAEALNELGMTEEAEDVLLKGIEVCPYSPDLYDLLVEYCVEKEDYDSAMAYCQKMMEQDPSYPNLWLSIARISACMEKYEDALKACDAAASLDEDMTSGACEVKASIYLAMGLPDKELEMYTAMLQNEMYDVGVAHDVGLIYETRGEYDVACQIFTEAINTNPREPTLYARMTLLLNKMNKPKEAYLYAQRTVKLDNQSSFAWSLMAATEWRCGKTEKVIPSLKKAFTCSECSVGAIAVFYEIFIANEVPNMRSLLKYVERADVDNPIAHCYMAALFFSMNDMQKSFDRLEQALEIDPENSLPFFLELCPGAKKKTEIKRLSREYRQVNKKP